MVASLLSLTLLRCRHSGAWRDIEIACKYTTGWYIDKKYVTCTAAWRRKDCQMISQKREVNMAGTYLYDEATHCVKLWAFLT